MIKVIHGNIFTTTCQTLVNTVNTQGVMGAGIALEMRMRYPEMFAKYKALCKQGLIEVGKLWLYRVSSDRQIINFPTKTSWKLPSRVDYLEKGLHKFINTHEEKGIDSIAFPLLGADKGGLDKDFVIRLMKQELERVKIPVEIYVYDASAKDDISNTFCERFKSKSEPELKMLGFTNTAIHKINSLVERGSIRNMGILAAQDGIGLKTIEKCYQLVFGDEQPRNPTFFD